MHNSSLGQSSAPSLGNNGAIISTLKPDFSIDGRYLVDLSAGSLRSAAMVVNVRDSQQIAAMLSHVTQEMLDNDITGDLVGAIVDLYDRLHPGPLPEFVS